MSRRLMQITDWPERAAEARWCCAALAQDCHVSLTTLERHFQDTLRQCPRAWLNAERQRRACELLTDGSTVKEVANLLGYKNQHHFSFAFKKHHGYAPSLHRKTIENKRLHIAKQTPDARRQTPDARRQTPDARRQTPDARIVPGTNWRFDEFKYRNDEFRYNRMFSNGGTLWSDLRKSHPGNQKANEPKRKVVEQE